MSEQGPSETPKSSRGSKRPARILNLSDSDEDSQEQPSTQVQDRDSNPAAPATPSTSQQGQFKTPASKKRRLNPKRNQLLWQHFKEIDSDTVQCLNCQTKVPRKDSSTSGMRSHLQRHHGALYADFLEKTGTHISERVMSNFVYFF
jgi:hypothetical protein